MGTGKPRFQTGRPLKGRDSCWHIQGGCGVMRGGWGGFANTPRGWGIYISSENACHHLCGLAVHNSKKLDLTKKSKLVTHPLKRTDQGVFLRGDTLTLKLDLTRDCLFVSHNDGPFNIAFSGGFRAHMKKGFMFGCSGAADDFQIKLDDRLLQEAAR